MSVNINATAMSGCNIRWYGTDFNPSQADFARDIAKVSENGACLYDYSFEEFLEHSDSMPDFDYICLHGIWSWISKSNRDFIKKIIRKKLKIGGVVYISYNTLPGWNGFSLIKQMMYEHFKRMTSIASGFEGQINSSVEFIKELIKTDPNYIKINQAAKNFFEDMAARDRHYLAHEYFNEDWTPVYFNQMHDDLTEAKLDFACSATLIEQVPSLNLTEAQAKLLSGIHDRVLAECARDFMVNQQFRRDLWIKGARKISFEKQHQELSKFSVVLVVPASDVKYTVRGAVGEATLNKDIYSPIVKELSDFKPKTIGELEEKLKDKINFVQIREAIAILMGNGYIFPAQSQEKAELSFKNCCNMNLAILDELKKENTINLASPVLGSAYSVDRFTSFYVAEVIKKGALEKKIKVTADALANGLKEELASRGEKIIKDNKVIEEEKATLAELQSSAKTFVKDILPILRSLMIIR